MAENYATIKELVKNSIKITEKMKIFNVEKQTTETVPSELIHQRDEEFSIKGNEIAFTVDGNLYVTPYSRTAKKLLEKKGFREENFYVPFSDGTIPKKETLFWSHLCQKVAKQKKGNLLYECKETAERKELEKIPKKFLNESLIIPAEGIGVSKCGVYAKYYPLINTQKEVLNTDESNCIGTYSRSNRVTIFVYVDGNTYVTKNQEIVNKLEKAGFKETKMFVPFAAGETILDSYFAERWQRLGF
mgnify:FL=1